MLPANATLLRCPHCGAKKEVLQLMSGNTFRSTLWSDTKHIAPMLPRVSPVQRCPQCGKYYFYDNSVIAGQSDGYSSNQGNLPLEYLKEALAQLRPTGDEERNLRFLILWAFNDRYGQIEQTDIPAEEWEYHVTNAQRLLAMDTNPLMNAELHREIGNFEECIQILTTCHLEDNMQDFKNQILNEAKKQNRKIVTLYGKIERHAVTLDKYHESIYNPSEQDDDGSHLPF